MPADDMTPQRGALPNSKRTRLVATSISFRVAQVVPCDAVNAGYPVRVLLVWTRDGRCDPPRRQPIQGRAEPPRRSKVRLATRVSLRWPIAWPAGPRQPQ